MNPSSVALASVLALSIAACSDDVTRVGDNSGGIGGSVASGGTAGAAGAFGDLGGVWSIHGSSALTGTLVTGTLVLAPGQLVLSIDGASLVFADDGVAKSLHWTNPKALQDVELAVVHVPGDGAAGIPPLALGGQWSFAHPSEVGTCSAMLAYGSFDASCTGVTGEPVGFPSLNAELSATRISELAWLFGDLGGNWQIASNAGADGSCGATLSANNLSATCAGTSSALDGQLVFELEGGVGSGSTSQGFELSAVKLSASVESDAARVAGARISLAELALALEGDGTALELLERAEARARSFGIDVDDELDRDAQRWSRAFLPRIVAARAWSAHAPWAVASAALLESSDPRALRERLRLRSADPESTIALVLGAGSDELDIGRLAVRAQRLGRLGARLPAWISVLTRASERELVSPIPLGARDVVVLPRLGALARIDDFAAELEALRGADGRWRQRPVAR